jgi:hypothetical protein
MSELVLVPASADLAEALQALSAASGMPVHMVLDSVLSSTQPGPRMGTRRRSRKGWAALAFAGAVGVAAAMVWPALRKPR